MTGSEEVELAGGVGNGGAVVRIGDTVRRPATRHSAISRAVTRHLEQVGFDRAQRHLGTDEQGRDVFTYVEGEVPLPPFAPWVRTAGVLADVARLLRDFHAAMTGFDPGALASAELADPLDGTPLGGNSFCHNDVCPENVVFRDGSPVALLDFDYAAPGRALWDVARTVRMWAPAGVPGSGSAWPADIDVLSRIGIFTSGYGLGEEHGPAFADALIEATTQGQRWVRRKVDAGEPGFVRMWAERGLAASFATDLRWLTAHREAIEAAVGHVTTGT